MSHGFIPKHGGYRNLVVYRVAEIIYDFTFRFCNKYVKNQGRTYDQMVQAAHSGMQNIAEGSVDSGVSKASELKLTGIAKGSLQELKEDYLSYLRQRGLEQWENNSLYAQELIRARFSSAQEVIRWVGKHRNFRSDHFGANTAVILINVALGLLAKLIQAQEKDFMQNGGIRERMTRARLEQRKHRGK
ncbi:four helix bundle suffix domain-containing protein [Akkermansia massiliensis]|uniref:Four helix bundle suffix domain-containing protein n=4 Tax=Akkermansiaceae TaxID=1647988 RepID=A0ABT0R6F9_9BACT|nr:MULTISPECIES: four helix bundle suffix domain-containing protein [Akkermansia]MBT9604405.1 four helix bundle suffix domain-containing protein [Akkermansia muciniphila]MCL6656548.1 four helix bundle suffix domain-containing protein [Akkermansia massiliensis]QWP48264.1 four helix bundle suffix domain-containing protein [Akkermansia massiliensis]